jgi:hypothetical protein
MGNTVKELIAAIRNRNLVVFTYDGRKRVVVEPHAFGVVREGSQVLNAWRFSDSGEPPGWQQFEMRKVSDLTTLVQKFDHIRPGYVSGGGQSFTETIAAI